jgi:ABC-type multidrug transport system fused ATPase/permease subunit
MSNFWDLIGLMFSAFMFLAYLSVMFHVLADLFRDGEMGGLGKVAWIVGLIVLPFLTALVYVVARGPGMVRRQQAALQRTQGEAESYIRQVAGKSPADQIADARRLLDAGTISTDEYALLKAKALA